MSKTAVVLLGTGTPNAEPDRMGSALAVVVGDNVYLVDFGPGVVRRAAGAQRAGIEALRMENLTTAFLTHLHSDHTAGYADLIMTPWVLGRAQPLSVYGPPGLVNMTEHILAAYEMDRDMRVCGLEPTTGAGYGAAANEIGPGVCFQDNHVTVEAFEVDHGKGWMALGYQFTTSDRRIVISGDTAPMDSAAQLWKGCDVLVHEVYSKKGYDMREPHWQRYHAAMHTSTAQLAQIADRVRPNLLVLTHLLLWGSTEEELVSEIREHYDGEVVCGEDLGVY